MMMQWSCDEKAWLCWSSVNSRIDKSHDTERRQQLSILTSLCLMYSDNCTIENDC